MLVAIASPQAAFLADAASFVVSAAFILRLPRITAGAAAGEKPRGRFWPEFRGGVKYILSRRLLTLVIACMAAGFFILFMYDMFLALLTKACGIGEAGFGLIVSAVALGSVLGSLSRACSSAPVAWWASRGLGGPGRWAGLAGPGATPSCGRP